MENEKWLAVSQAIVDWLERITNRIKKRFAES
jgi:hypothetical protein